MLLLATMLLATVAQAAVTPGSVRLRVTLDPQHTTDDALAEQLARIAGGTLAPGRDRDGFIITANPSAVAVLRSDPRVQRIEELATVATVRHVTDRPVMANTETTFTLGPYAYDGAGNITAIGTQDQYRYDALQRLKTATIAGTTQEYTYDRYGNIINIRTGTSDVSIGIDATTNRLSSAPTGNAYGDTDPAGRLTEYVDRDTFAYDALDMLKESVIQGHRKVYLYTPNEERIATLTIEGGTETTSTWTLRNLGQQVARTYAKTMVGGERWSWQEDYIYAGDKLVAAEVATPAGTLHFHNDHLGTPRLITGNGGATVARHTYWPFGLEITPTYQDAESRKFTGHERDIDTGGAVLDYMHARYYTPGLGRFLSVDPVLDVDRAMHHPQGWNRYSYVENDPTNKSDPNGKCSSVQTCSWQIAFALAPSLGRFVQTAFVHAVGQYAQSRALGYGAPVIVPGALSEGVTWGSKIDKQLGKRGWDAAGVHDIVNNPDRVMGATDQRHRPDGTTQDEPATAYLDSDGNYVVVNDRTGEVVQVSDKNDPNWKIPDFKPKEEHDPNSEEDAK